jgi:hypothetical protein
MGGIAVVDVFVSHAGRDRPWAEWAAWQSEHAGLSVELVESRRELRRPHERSAAVVQDHGGAIVRSVFRADEVDVHYVQAFADLTKAGQPPPAWAQLMAKKRRKTLVVCRDCHDTIHAQQPTATPRSNHPRAG